MALGDSAAPMFGAQRRKFCVSASLLGFGIRPALAAATPFAWADAKRVVDAASLPGTPWLGPRSGPTARPSKNIALCAQDLHNGGVLGVAEGVREAARVIGWDLHVFHADGSARMEQAMLAGALDAKPDAVIVLASDHHTVDLQLRDYAGRAPVIGWHVASQPGPLADSSIFLNISTDPIEVARVTALAAMLPTRGQAGVVIFTDTRFEIARVKAEQMAAVVLACGGTVLEMLNLPISDTAAQVPPAVRLLVDKYQARWTHALAINDIYFDHAVPTLIDLGMGEDRSAMLSAGDGSASAVLRILAGAFQTSTVAEPLNLQGWQLIDELNRRFAGQAPSGYVPPAHLITQANLDYDGEPRLTYDPDNGYRQVYRRIWGRES